MIELKKAGLYIANGKHLSVLVRVVGEYPMLNIVSGVLLNDMMRDGTVTILTEKDAEIQDILCNPKDYVFDFPAVTEAVANEKGIKGVNAERGEYAEYNEDTFRTWVDLYKEYRKLYPEQFDVKMIIYIMKSGSYNMNQAQLILKQIKVRLRTQGQYGCKRISVKSLSRRIQTTSWYCSSTNYKRRLYTIYVKWTYILHR